MPTDATSPANLQHAIPRRYWPLQMLTAFPEGPPLTVKVPLTIDRFPDSHDGRLAGEAGILTSALLQGGFVNDPDPTHTFSTLPCPSWLHLVADLTYNMAHGLSVAHEPTNLHDPPLTNLDINEIASVQGICDAAFRLATFFHREQKDLEVYTKNDICLRCLKGGDQVITEERLSMTAKACGQDLEAARLSSFNEGLREIALNLREWKTSTLADAKAAIIEQITEGSSSGLLTHDDPALQDWVRAQADSLRSSTLDWIADATKAQVLEQRYIRDIEAEQAQLGLQFEKDMVTFRSVCQKALEGHKETTEEECKSELARFKHELKTDYAQRKECAIESVEAGLRSATKSISVRPSPIKRQPPCHNTPKPRPNPLPSPIIAPSQTPPETSMMGPLSPIAALPLASTEPPPATPKSTEVTMTELRPSSTTPTLTPRRTTYP
jgi:hypothetical protein